MTIADKLREVREALLAACHSTDGYACDIQSPDQTAIAPFESWCRSCKALANFPDPDAVETLEQKAKWVDQWKQEEISWHETEERQAKRIAKKEKEVGCLKKDRAILEEGHRLLKKEVAELESRAEAAEERAGYSDLEDKIVEQHDRIEELESRPDWEPTVRERDKSIRGLQNIVENLQKENSNLREQAFAHRRNLAGMTKPPEDAIESPFERQARRLLRPDVVSLLESAAEQEES